MRSIIAAALVVAATALIAAPASARSVAPSITLDQAAPALGDVVTFTTSYPTSVRNPRVQVLCTQDGAVVFGTAGHPSESFTLGGAWSPWLVSGGPAECRADLFDVTSRGGRQYVTALADVAFTAGG
jgi:hypothetical protein